MSDKLTTLNETTLNETTLNETKPHINADEQDRYQKNWNKLDKGVKLNRLLFFIKQESLRRSLQTNQEKQLKQLLFNLCSNNGLNKSSDVIYDLEKMIITEIKILLFNEETKKYSIKHVAVKSKHSSKSKTNIEKHFTPKKS